MQSEWLTRKLRIDKRLQAAGWVVRPWQDGPLLDAVGPVAFEEYPTAHGPVDYALLYRGRVVGVVEAKRVGVAPGNVLNQAERYARGLPHGPLSCGADDAFGVPFLFSTNGEEIWFEDVRRPDYRSRRLAAFHTPAALEELLDRNVETAAAWCAATPNTHALRPYQLDAIAAVEAAIGSSKRQMLVAMATGTGKTFTTVSLIYRLIRSGLARRVLFLVDRRSLAAQAVRAFTSFEAEPNQKFDAIYPVYSQRFHQGDLEDDAGFDPNVLPEAYLKQPGPAHTFVYVSTIQRMAIYLHGREGGFTLSGDAEREDDAAGKIEMPIHAFDVIVADECHRG